MHKLGKTEKTLFFFFIFSPNVDWVRGVGLFAPPPSSFLSVSSHSHSISKILFDTIKTVPVSEQERKAYPYSHRLKWFKWQRREGHRDSTTGAGDLFITSFASSPSAPLASSSTFFLFSNSCLLYSRNSR